MTFSIDPEPITARQRTIVIVVALVCAATRFLALARSVWDWDEALFTMALRDYDVTFHHPHPPGFPVFIALARVARLVVPDDFRALQAVNLIAAMLVFPAVYFFARELRLRFMTCVMAGALFAFFPNVWFFGGGAFSDIPSIVLVLFAVTLLFRGARDPSTSLRAGRKSYWLGTLLLALSIGIRPQNFLIGLIPGIYATRKRRPTEILAALAIGVVVVGVAYGGAVYATRDFDEYVRIVREHGQYISRVDSWRSDERPPLWRIFDRFFIKQYQSPPLSIVASLLAMISMAGTVRERDRSITETKPDGFVFRRERGNLWNIARRHYFEIELQPLREQPRFLSGWYSPRTPNRCRVHVELENLRVPRRSAEGRSQNPGTSSVFMLLPSALCALPSNYDIHRAQYLENHA